MTDDVKIDTIKIKYLLFHANIDKVREKIILIIFIFHPHNTYCSMLMYFKHRKFNFARMFMCIKRQYVSDNYLYPSMMCGCSLQQAFDSSLSKLSATLGRKFSRQNDFIFIRAEVYSSKLQQSVSRSFQRK